MGLAQEKGVKRKSIIIAVILCVVLLAWAVKYYFPSKPPAELPKQNPVTVQPSPAGELPQNKPEPKTVLPPHKPSVERRATGSQRLITEKQTIVDDNKEDLSEHTMSITHEEKKGYQIMPGVNVKSGVVHVQVDKNKDRTIEIEKNPDNSNSDYQVMMRKKF